jgi:hypothetical protein
MKDTHLDYDAKNKEWLMLYETAHEKDHKIWTEGRLDQHYVSAKSVFVGAGALGTTEIILCSLQSLALSDKHISKGSKNFGNPERTRKG